MKKTIDNLDGIIHNSYQFMEGMREIGYEPYKKKTYRKFSITEVSDILKLTETEVLSSLKAINKKCSQDFIIEEEKRSGVYYFSIFEINLIREFVFGKRKPCEAMVLGIANQKGGVGKTTTAINLVHYLAIRGYKVLVLDIDPQSSFTELMGYNPDSCFDRSDTILKYLDADAQTLDYAIIKTHIENVDLVPSCSQLHYLELEAITYLAEADRDERITFFNGIKSAVDSVKHNYDFVIMDIPPTLGIIPISSLIAMDNIIVPCGPNMLDFASTIQFFKMLKNAVYKVDPNKVFGFIKVLVTKLNTKHSSEIEFQETLEKILPDNMFKNSFYLSTALSKANTEFKTPYEMKKSDKRIISNMNLLFEEIENDCLEIMSK